MLEGDLVSVRVPYWRAGRDLNHAEDLIEELGRSIGYFAIPGKPPPPKLPDLHYAQDEFRSRRAAYFLSRAVTTKS